LPSILFSPLSLSMTGSTAERRRGSRLIRSVRHPGCKKSTLVKLKLLQIQILAEACKPSEMWTFRRSGCFTTTSWDVAKRFIAEPNDATWV
jgi:hypothetical protein